MEASIPVVIDALVQKDLSGEERVAKLVVTRAFLQQPTLGRTYKRHLISIHLAFRALPPSICTISPRIEEMVVDPDVAFSGMSTLMIVIVPLPHAKVEGLAA